MRKYRGRLFVVMVTIGVVLLLHSAYSPHYVNVMTQEKNTEYRLHVHKRTDDGDRETKFTNSVGVDTSHHEKESSSTQRERLAMIRSTCSSLKSVRMGKLSEKRLRGHMVYDRKSNLLFCDLPKVGSTFLKQVLHIVMGHRQIADPFKITGNEAHAIPFNTFVDLPLDEILPIMMDSIKVIFVRNPYYRVVSGYVDKIFTNNHVFWGSTGRTIIKEHRNISTARSIRCGHDVSFSEFVRHIVKSEKENVHRNPHWYPMYDSCRPCSMRYNFIGKTETFKTDIEEMLSLFGASDKVNISNMDQKNDDEAISLTVKRAFDTAQKRQECVSLIQALERAWRVLQIRGVVHFKSPFPENFVKSQKQISLPSFTTEVRKAIEKMPMSKTMKAQVRDEIVYKAYNSLSKTELNDFHDVFSLDFRFFGYNMSIPKISSLGEDAHYWNPFSLKL